MVMATEALRLEDVTVMDIYAMQASPSELASELASATALTLLQSVVEEWIYFAISVQERQSVALLTLHIASHYCYARD
jgi:hypothetical protein